MSFITEIKGWVEVDGFKQEENSKRFQEALKQLKCLHGWRFRCHSEECQDHAYSSVPNMFVEIPDSGTKNPHFIVFAATINYSIIDEFIEFFEEELLTRLAGFRAFVFINREQSWAFCKYYKGDRSEGGWELVDEIKIPSDDLGETCLEMHPEIDSKTRMLMRLF